MSGTMFGAAGRADAGPKTRILLLVEDNPADADLVRELLEEAGGDHYDILHVPRLSEAQDTLRARVVDVVLLDLRLPDGVGVDTVMRLREIALDVPIVVLTGTDDERLAISCIDAGAQDYLCKGDIGSISLRRAIGYAITRVREAQLRDLQETLARYRGMASASSGTTVTAALAGSGAVAVRYPGAFQELVDAYCRLLEPYLDRLVFKIDAPRAEMERIVTALGDAGGGPRDLLDVHVAALDRASSGRTDLRSRAIVVEARLLALEMMGLLVDYYRVGQRRRFAEGPKS